MLSLVVSLAAQVGGAAPAGASAPQEPPPLVRVAWSPASEGAVPEGVAVGEPFRLGLEIELAPGALEGELLPLLNRPLELPLSVQGAWFEPDARFERLAAEGADGPRVVLGDAVGPLVRLGSDGPGARFGAEGWLVVEVPGTLELPPATVRYATADAFEIDWLGERRARGRNEGFARSEPLALEVRDWPLAPATAAFVGAVGEFTLTARAEPQDLELGDELSLTLELVGRGGAWRFAPPERLELAGFDDLGSTTEDASRDPNQVALTTTYRLRATAPGVIDLQPPRWAWVAPGGRTTVDVQPAAIPLVVRGELPEPEPSVAPEPEPDPEQGETAWALDPLIAAAALGLVLLLAVGGVVVRRRAR